MKKKIEYVIVELNQPSEAAIERLNREIHRIITSNAFVEMMNEANKIDEIETKKRS